jgi:hypothetical protein
MKTITKTTKLYNIHELTEEAQEKAYQEWRGDESEHYYDSEIVKDVLKDYLAEMLKEYGIEGDVDNIFFSLSHCQGDGVMFEGTFVHDGYTFKVVHSGHYHHYNSKTIDIDLDSCDVKKYGKLEAEKREYDFDELYVAICKKLEKTGYSKFESLTSRERFEDESESNDVFFTEDGTRWNG